MSPIHTTFELCIIVAVQFQIMLQLIVIEHFMKEYMLLLLKNENKCRKNYTQTVLPNCIVFSVDRMLQIGQQLRDVLSNSREEFQL